MGVFSGYLEHRWFGYRRAWLAVVYLLASSIPLLSGIGQNIEYEYALMVAMLLAVAIPAVALLIPGEYFVGESGEYAVDIFDESLWIFVASPIICAVPAIFAYTLQLCACSGSGSVFWIVVFLMPMLCFAHAVHHAVLCFRVRGFGFWILVLALLLLFGFLTVSAVVQFWIFPQVRVHHLLFGFLHGPIYDLWIPVDEGIVWSRLSHFLFALSLLLFVWSFLGLVARYWPVVVIGCGLSFSFVAGSFPSVAIGPGVLQVQLSSVIERQYFRIFFPGDVAAKIKDSIAAQVEFHVEELREIIGEDAPRVDVYVYPDRDRKKLWFGGGATDVADIHTPSIHISVDQYEPHPTLRHELVHALTSHIGFFGFGFHPNMAITEGLAMALAPSADDGDLHADAAVLIHTKRLPNTRVLFSPMFWRESGRRAYTTAGSIMLYVLQKYGFGRVRMLYAGESFEKAFGRSRVAVLREWRDHLVAAYPQKDGDLVGEALFRFAGVFADHCPHSKVDLGRSRQESLFTRLRQPLGWDPGRDYRPWRLALEPDSKDVRFGFWRADLRALAVTRPLNRERLTLWLQALRQFRQSPPKVLEDVEMAIAEADVLSLMGETAASVGVLRQLEQLSYRYQFGRSVLRQIAVRLSVEAHLSPVQAQEWRGFLAGWSQTFPREVVGSWVVAYLQVRNRDESLVGDAGRLLDLANWPKAEIGLDVARDFRDDFVFEWHKHVAYRLAEEGLLDVAVREFNAAAEVYQRMQGSGSEWLKLESRRHQWLLRKILR
jgi:hypothetical protein